VHYCSVSFFVTARCGIVQSAVLRLHVVCLSVRLSVCDVGGSRPHRPTLEISETNCTDISITSSLFDRPKVIHLLPGEHEGIWGRLEMGCGKVACLSTKAAISLKRVKIDEKLLWRPYTNALSNGTIRDPLRPPLPHDWGFASPTQNCNRYYLRNG